MSRPAVTRERGVRIGREQRGEVALAGHEIVEVHGDQRAGWPGLAADGPRRFGLHQQPLAVHVGIGIAGHVDLDQLAILQQVLVAVEEILLHRHEVAFEAFCAVVVRTDREVVGRALMHQLRRRQRRAARPFLHDARIARFGHRARSEIGADVDVVGIDPTGLGLRDGHEEAVLDERFRGQVEFAHFHRVAAARRQRHQAMHVIGLHALRTLEHPLLAFGLVERVDVQHRFPPGVGLLEFGQRGAPPDSARMRLVLPEVVQIVAHSVHVGNARLGVEHLQDSAARLAELRRFHERLPGDGVLRVHPFHRTWTAGGFQPKVGIGGRRG